MKTAHAVRVDCPHSHSISMKQKVLVLDDRSDELQALTARLTSYGYELLVCYSSEDALKLGQDERPALALVAGKFPEIDASRVAEQLYDNSTVPSYVIVD